MDLELLTGLLLLLLLCSCGGGSQVAEQEAEAQEPERTILEMLHIDRVSVSHRQIRPHPYMRRLYQRLSALGLGGAGGTLVQSFRSVGGPPGAPPGWIWFNVSSVQGSMPAAELVLFRKTLHPWPLSVTVALHTAAPQGVDRQDGPVLEERQLRLEQRPASGYDVFDVSTALVGRPSLEAVGFQLRYRDEGGSLVLHQALTQSLYALDPGPQPQPLLVLYQRAPDCGRFGAPSLAGGAGAGGCQPGSVPLNESGVGMY